MGFKLRVDHYFHTVPSDEGEALTLLKKLITKTDKIMASLEQFESALSRIDAATTGIAQQLRDLKDQVAGGGLSADVEAQVLSRLETAATQLEQVGTSVENPVPPVEG